MRILVGSDNQDDRDKLTRLLTAWDFEVLVARNGEEAWKILKSETGPRLALVAWEMPGMPASEVCRQVRTNVDGNYIYILVLGKREKGGMVEALEAGADDFITSTFEPDELRARLNTAKRILDLEEHLLASLEVMRVQASHDALTGIFNHGMIIETLDKELSRSAREHSAVGVLFVDFDHFKKVNDTYGHQAGNMVLAEGTRRFKKCLRPYDSLGRYGGEEFLLVLPSITPEALMGVAERVRQAVSGSPFLFEGSELQVTTSVGVGLSIGKMNSMDLLKIADDALYRAKRGGRNRVAV